jgi:hypothetical protein
MPRIHARTSVGLIDPSSRRSKTSVVSTTAARESGTLNAQSVSQWSQVHPWMRPVSLVCRTPLVVPQ